MKFFKLNSLLILLMLFVSHIHTYENLNLENSELEQQMKNNAISLNDNGESELNKFYEQENHKYYNDIHYAPQSISNKEKIEEIKFLEKKQNKKPQKKKVVTKKGKKPIKKLKPGKFQDSFKHIANKAKKPAKKYPHAKIIAQHNPYFPKKKDTIARETKASYCKHKNGFLYLVKSPKSLGVAPLSIKTVPVYISLTMSSLKVQMGLSLKTLFDTIHTKNILRITKKFKNAYCFEIVEDKIMEKTLAKTPIVLCASTSKSLLQWVKALQEFKDCIYNIGSSDYGVQTLVDFNRVNRLIKPPGPAAKPKGFDPMYYNNGPPLKKKKPEYVMKKQLAGIVGLLERGKINNQKIKRKMKDKLHKAKRIEYDIRMKKGAIDKIMNHRRNREKENENKFRSHMQKKREVQLLRAVKSRINQYKKKEGKKLNKMAKNRLHEIKNRANDEAKGLMKSLLNQSKLTPYDECIHPKLKGFNDTTYIKSHCFNIYGEEKVKQCMIKKEFCPLCCNFHIGVKFGNKRNDCNRKCSKIVNYKSASVKGKGKSKAKKGKGKKGKGKKGKGKSKAKKNKKKSKKSSKGKKKNKKPTTKKEKKAKIIKKKEIIKTKSQIQIKEDLIKKQKEKLKKLKFQLMEKKQKLK